ncbi:MAG: hypothetical protein CMC96_08200 [Flavobacteriales bacterium]|nr:hypothetical protein [Flavobacteriales bacterium]|tara:strand:- start:87635 stop:88342 length:708 start_codon:yes stop_codon:yes gene_type:complete
MKKITFLLLTSILSTSIFSQSVKVVGEMKKVMMGIDWSDHISWDTLNTHNLFALAPISGLKGEVTIINGTVYQSTVKATGDIELSKNQTGIQSPFAVYAHIEKWDTIEVKQAISSNQELYQLLEKESKIDLESAFPIRLIGEFESVDFHIINANEKSKENHSHAAHKEIQEHFSVKNSNGEILGFYSKNHQGIFTHKGSYFHLHFVDSEEFNMGHVEGFSTKKNVQLLLPKYKTK